MTGPEQCGYIGHKAIVREVDGESVTVVISSQSACSGCHAEGSCNLSGREEKLINVNGKYEVFPGQDVTVFMKKATGYAALFLGYVIPLILVVAVLIITNILNFSELSSALLSIGILIPYYSLIYLFKNKINNRFTFSIATDK